MEFRSGNRVVFVGHPGVRLSVEKDELGTVLYVDTHHNIVFVRWDMFDDGRHTCDGLCENGHGWKVDPKYITHFIDDLGYFTPNNTSDAINNLLGGYT